MFQKKNQKTNQKQFLFDQNKCVACHACVLACQIENNNIFGNSFRHITNNNIIHHPDLPLFNLSLACNHCADAPCLHNCPALAYSIDLTTGTIDHNPQHCIGCRYCTWVCPYDAPIYNHEKGIVEKCTFCKSLQEEGADPACVTACPTGALETEERTNGNSISHIFKNAETEPALNIVDVYAQRQKPIMAKTLTEKSIIVKTQLQRISIKEEWPLIYFTFQTPILWAWIAASHFTPSLFFSGTIASILLIIGLLFSAMHLGKKVRAYRAILNLKKSWLSREILSYGVFAVLYITHIFVYQSEYLVWSSIVVGFLSLLSIDMVYAPVYNPNKKALHSAQTLATGLLFIAFFTHQTFIFWVMALFKAIVYLQRKNFLENENNRKKLLLYALRADLVFGFPLIFVFFDGEWVVIATLISLISGEIIDRIEFYDELKKY